MAMQVMDESLMALDQWLEKATMLPMYSDEERLWFLAGAWRGDQQARQMVVMSCVPYMLEWAWSRLALWESLEVWDLVHRGCEVLLEAIDQAQGHVDPIAYLLKTTKWGMFRRSGRDASLIRLPEGETSPGFVSLNAPGLEENDTPLADLLVAPDGGGSRASERDYTALYAALEQLSEERRRVLARRFGLFGEAPTSLADLAREVFPELSARQAVNRLSSLEKQALLQLNRVLAADYLPETQCIPHEFYTYREVAALFGMNVGTVYDWTRQGRLLGYTTAQGYVYAKREVDALLEQVRAAREAYPVEEYYTRQEVVKLAGVGTTTVCRWVQRGLLREYWTIDEGLSKRAVYARVEVQAVVEARRGRGECAA